MREAIAGRMVGARVPRVEDPRLLTGRGRYVDDLTVPGMAHAAFLRSPYPHARIVSVDVAEARALPGVRTVLTGADMQTMTGAFVGMMPLDGLYDPPFFALAVDRVRLVGDPVAIVVADTRRVAEDGCELIDVEYEALPAVASMAQAQDPSRPPIWPKAGGNVLYRGTNSHGAVDLAFADADRIITETFEQHRHSNQPMETRGAVAEIDPITGELILHSSTQSAHGIRWAAALLLGNPPIRQSLCKLATNREHTRKFVVGARAHFKANPSLLGATRQMMPAMSKAAIREPRRLAYMMRSLLALVAKDPAEIPTVIAGDIGGAFGAKTPLNREDVALCAAALHLGRSVKWIEDRNEHLTVGGQAREETLAIRVAVKNDGTILGFRVGMTMDVGAYPAFPFGAPLFARIIEVMVPGPYRLRGLEFETVLTASNKGTYVAYRGPWAAETWVRERMMDVLARRLGITRAEIRLRNMIGPDELPTKMVTGPPLDVRMSARATLQKALELADFEGWEARKEAARTNGRCVGLGFATYIEAAPGPPGFFDFVMPGMGSMFGAEPVRMVLDADGVVTVHTQQVPHGQGHETTLAQVAADQLGVPMSSVRVQYGNSRIAPFGMNGTGGSRSAAMAGGAVTVAAAELRDRIVDVAADLLEASRADLLVEDGRIFVQGTPSIAVTLPEVAAEAIRRGPEVPGGGAMLVNGAWDGGEGGWAQATHVCWVEVDLETGQVHIDRYLVVEDCGELINPAIVEGQIRGGVAQGVGAVLYEKSAYDDDGNFQAGTFMDYLIPTSMEIPEIEIHHIETPSSIKANYRGVGEGGMIGAPAAITNAIEDALSEFGVTITEQHLPPTRILELAGVIPTRR
jgi:carbon-monoxide dehydrogenase large subunit